MSICGLQGRAYTDPSSPEAPGICDDCGFKYMYKDLSFQYQWGGNQLINLGFLVCWRCLDEPSEWLKSIILPPDPQPILNPRPGFYKSQEAEGQSEIPANPLPPGTLFTESGLPIYTESGFPIEIDTGIPIPYPPIPPNPPLPNVILTESGLAIQTESGLDITIDTGSPLPPPPFPPTPAPANYLLAENWITLQTESGQDLMIG